MIKSYPILFSLFKLMYNRVLLIWVMHAQGGMRELQCSMRMCVHAWVRACVCVYSRQVFMCICVRESVSEYKRDLTSI